MVRMHSRARRQIAIEKTKELQNTVEHWDKDVGQCCNEFIRGKSMNIFCRSSLVLTEKDLP